MKRLLTAAAGVPFILLITVWGPAWAFGSLVALSATLALDEFFKLRVAVGALRPGYWFLPLGGALTLSFLGSVWSVLGTLSAALALLSLTSLGRSISGAPARRRLSNAIAGLFYTCFLLGTLILLSRGAVLTLVAIVWAGDAAAYYAGRAWGRHPLAPALSPKKTIEGALAGTIASIVVGMIIGWRALGVPHAPMAALSLVTAMAAQAGDLFESRLKRKAGVKDSSNKLPGHGGVLDRVDSLLFAAPAFYLLSLFFL